MTTTTSTSEIYWQILVLAKVIKATFHELPFVVNGHPIFRSNHTAPWGTGVVKNTSSVSPCVSKMATKLGFDSWTMAQWIWLLWQSTVDLRPEDHPKVVSHCAWRGALNAPCWCWKDTILRTLLSVYGVGANLLLHAAWTPLWRHIYAWNFVDCDEKQPINLT